MLVGAWWAHSHESDRSSPSTIKPENPSMKTATVANAKSHLSSLLAAVEAGEEVVITRRGRPIARLVPEPGTACNWDTLEAWVESGPPASGITVAELREQDLL